MDIWASVSIKVDILKVLSNVMQRRVLVFVFEIAVLAGLLTVSNALASDGDVDYSAPYITVDPETGQLITVNPGPQLKVHPPVSSDPTIDVAANSPDAQSSLRQEIAAGSAKQQPGLFSIVSTIVAVILVSAAIFVFRSGQKRKTASASSMNQQSQNGSSRIRHASDQ